MWYEKVKKSHFQPAKTESWTRIYGCYNKEKSKDVARTK